MLLYTILRKYVGNLLDRLLPSFSMIVFFLILCGKEKEKRKKKEKKTTTLLMSIESQNYILLGHSNLLLRVQQQISFLIYIRTQKKVFCIVYVKG
jgi:hypothetical protein